jgi:hypothetical protein
MSPTLPPDIVVLLKKKAEVANERDARRRAVDAVRRAARDDDDARRRALATALFSFVHELEQAAQLPSDGVEIWSRPGMRGADTLRVAPGSRLSFVARRGPRPACIVVNDAAEAAAVFGGALLQEWVNHVDAGGVWDHLRAHVVDG